MGDDQGVPQTALDLTPLQQDATATKLDAPVTAHDGARAELLALKQDHPELHAKRHDLSRQLAEASSQLAEAYLQHSKLLAQHTALERKYEELQAHTQEADSKLDAASARYGLLEAQLTYLKAWNEALQTTEAGNPVMDPDQRSTAAEHELANLRQEKIKWRRWLAGVQAQLGQAQTQNTDLQLQVQSQNEAQRATEAAMQAQQQKAKQLFKNSLQRVATLQAKVAALQHSHPQLQAARDELLRESSALGMLIEDLNSWNNCVRLVQSENDDQPAGQKRSQHDRAKLSAARDQNAAELRIERSKREAAQWAVQIGEFAHAIELQRLRQSHAQELQLIQEEVVRLKTLWATRNEHMLSVKEKSEKLLEYHGLLRKQMRLGRWTAGLPLLLPLPDTPEVPAGGSNALNDSLNLPANSPAAPAGKSSAPPDGLTAQAPSRLPSLQAAPQGPQAFQRATAPEHAAQSSCPLDNAACRAVVVSAGVQHPPQHASHEQPTVPAAAPSSGCNHVLQESAGQQDTNASGGAAQSYLAQDLPGTPWINGAACDNTGNTLQPAPQHEEQQVPCKRSATSMACPAEYPLKRWRMEHL